MVSKKAIESYPKILREYLNYINIIEGKSYNTVMAYGYDIFKFLKFESKKKSKDISPALIFEVTKTDILEYLFYLQGELNCKSNTRSRCITSLKMFYAYLAKTKAIETSPAYDITAPKQGKRLPKYLEVDECKLLLESIDTDFTERDYCIATMLLNTGMRLSELINIDLSDIKDNTIKLHGKGNKERNIYMNEAVKEALQDYLKEREKLPQIIDKQALFLSRRTKKRLSGRRVEQIITGALKAAGLADKGYSVHKLRHTAATLMYSNGVNILAIQEILGHEELSTTQIYTHIANKEVQNAMEQSPMANFKRKK